MLSQTNVVSFVLRFVQETTDAPADLSRADWHGIIKHVQTDNEQHFTHLTDAIAFMSRYVKLDDCSAISSAETSNSPAPNLEPGGDNVLR